MLGHPACAWIDDPSFWKNSIHPQDRDRTVASRAAATADRKDHQVEYRMIDVQGRTRWVRDLVTVVVERTRAVRLRGVTIDITESRHSEEALREALEKAQQSDRLK